MADTEIVSVEQIRNMTDFGYTRRVRMRCLCGEIHTITDHVPDDEPAAHALGLIVLCCYSCSCGRRGSVTGRDIRRFQGRQSIDEGIADGLAAAHV